MRCVTHSEPGADFNIRRELDQTQLNGDDKRGVYTIQSLTEQHEGVYVCFATNSITSRHQFKKIRLLVAQPPVAVDPIPDSR